MDLINAGIVYLGNSCPRPMIRYRHYIYSNHPTLSVKTF